MNKIFALISNELTKARKKTTIIVILAITLAGILLLAAGTKVIMGSTIEGYHYDNTDYYEELIKSNNEKIATLESELAEANADSSEQIKYAIALLKRDNRDYELSIECGSCKSEVNITLPRYFSDLIMTMADAECMPESVGYEVTDARLAMLRESFENKDYSKWIEFEKDILPELYEDEEIRRIQSDALDLRLKSDPRGQGLFDGEIRSIVELRSSLYDNGSTPLSAEKRADYENRIASLSYRVEHNVSYDSQGIVALTVLDGFGLFMITLLVIILAGGSISGELSTGSIKSLIIAPVRRWKIYAAKLISLVLIGLVAVVGLYFVNSIVTVIFYGSGSFVPYICAAGGRVSAIPAPIYRLFCALLGYLDIMLFTFFAFMLSAVSRNTATSVGVSMAVYFGGGIITKLLYLFSDSILDRIAKFMPSSNMSLASRIFPDMSSDLFGELITGGSGQNSITFSLCYIAVVSVCMLLSAYDSFTKRDI